MIKFTRDDNVDVDKYLEHLRYNGYITYNRDRMLSTCDYEKNVQHTLEIRALEIMKFGSSCHCFDLDRQSVYNYLVNYAGCPDHYFHPKKSSDFSLDSGKVLSRLLANNYAKSFLSLYMESKSKKIKCGKASNLATRSTKLHGVSKLGHDLATIYYNVNEQQNLRCNYNNEDVIAIPKEYNDCIEVEDGYFLAWGDFAQSDFRIAYNLMLRSKENDAIMNQYADKYEALARIVAMHNNTKFDAEEFKKDRPLYKKLTLATMYGTGNSAVAEEAKFINMFTDFLKTCPRYTEYRKRLNDHLDLNLPLVVEGYFGHTETIPMLYDRSSVIDKALNTPIQTGTSEIVILTVNKILDLFFEHGYTEDDISVFYVRHDEPIFKIKESVLADIWLLEEASTIIVDNWIPLQMDFHYGYVYKQPDTELEESIHEVVDRNSSLITKYEIGCVEESKEFYPVKPVYKLYMAVEKLESVWKTVLAIYSLDQHAVSYSLIESVNDDQIKYFIMSKFKEFSGPVAQNGYKAIIVQSDIFDAEDFENRLYIRYLQKDTPELFNARVLCRFMALKYCAKYSIKNSIAPIHVQQENLIKTVKELHF